MNTKKILFFSIVAILFAFAYFAGSSSPSVPDVQAAKFNDGDRVQTNVYGVLARTSPGLGNNVIAFSTLPGTSRGLPRFSKGTIVSSTPTSRDGHNWWYVKWDFKLSNGSNYGWTAEQYLNLISASPSTQTNTDPKAPQAPPTLPTAYSGCISFSPQAYIWLGPVQSGVRQDPRTTEDVKKLQSFLIERNYMAKIYLSSAFGYGTFGSVTRNAADRFLRDVPAMTPNIAGVLGRTALDKISEISCSSSGILWADRTKINSGEATLLRWKPDGMRICSPASTPRSSQWNERSKSTLGGVQLVTPAVTTTYHILCVGGSVGQNSETGQVTISVSGNQPPPQSPNAPKIELKANGVGSGSGVIPALSAGQILTLSRTVSGAAACEIDISGVTGGPFGLTPVTQDEFIGPNHPWYPTSGGTTYTLTCYGMTAGGSLDRNTKSSDSVTATAVDTTTPPPPPPPLLDPVISSIIPTSVAAGGTVSVYGSNFGPNPKITFDQAVMPTTVVIGDDFVNRISSISLGFSVPTNASVGTHTIQVVTADGRYSNGVTINVTSSTPPPPTAAPVITSFTANPASITAGNYSSLSWRSADAATCTLSSSLAGAIGTYGTFGAINVNPAQTTTYTITCFAVGTSANKSVTVTVTPSTTPPPPPPAPPNVTIAAVPTSIQAGQPTNIGWASTNASSCTASGAWSGTRNTSGYQTLYPSQNSTYTLTCLGPGGSASNSVTVSVSSVPPPLPNVTLTADKTSITAGQTVTLTWSSKNISSCSGSSNVRGTDTANVISQMSLPSGTFTDAPKQTTIYSFACVSSNYPNGPGASQSATVTVIPVITPPTPTAPIITSFTANPSTITAGQSAQLNWYSSNTTRCAATSPSGWTTLTNVAGAQIVYPNQTTTYAITCYNAAGQSTSANTIVNISPATVSRPPLAVGTWIELTSETNVRNQSTTDGYPIGSQPSGARGLITNGPMLANGYTWWKVNYDSGPDGWSIGDNMIISADSFITTPAPATPPPATSLVPADIGVAVVGGPLDSFTTRDIQYLPGSPSEWRLLGTRQEFAVDPVYNGLIASRHWNVYVQPATGRFWRVLYLTWSAYGSSAAGNPAPSSWRNLPYYVEADEAARRAPGVLGGARWNGEPVFWDIAKLRKTALYYDPGRSLITENGWRVDTLTLVKSVAAGGSAVVQELSDIAGEPPLSWQQKESQAWASSAVLPRAPSKPILARILDVFAGFIFKLQDWLR